MRFGVWAAAAAALLCASQASAQSFTQYRIAGSGTIAYYNSLGQFLSYNDTGFTAIFDVLTTPGAYYNGANGTYTSDGSVFQALGPLFGTESADGTLSGQLSYTQTATGSGYGNNATVNVAYADGDMVGGFPLSFANPVAGGMITASTRNFGFSNGYDFSGRIASISVAGQTNQFQLLALSVPEPSSWLAMILGFGIVGTALRAKRRYSPHSAFS